jgi:histidinol-phosphate aminotransferase
MKHIDPSCLFFGNGSDEPIDLVYRVFCEPLIDNVVAMDPSYGMYKVSADINNVEYRKVLLNEDFSLDAEKLLAAVDEHTKVIFLCSPNNPTGNDIAKSVVFRILNEFQGIIVIDEAYIDISERESYLKILSDYPNLILLQTFSKAWGLASIRLGMAFACPEIIGYLNKVKYPYNINLLTQSFVEQEIKQQDRKSEWVRMLIEQRQILIDNMKSLPVVRKIYPSDANFVLIRVDDANSIYKFLVDRGVIVRNRNNVSLCMGCLRITVGIPEESAILVNELRKLK